MIFYLRIVPAIVYIATFFSPLSPNGCGAKNNTGTSVLKITYSITGGRGGNYENLEVNPDSLFYLEARRGVEKIIEEKTAKSFWNDLASNINLKDFSNIKSNPGHALYDGIDITITVETTNKKYSIVNGNEDTLNYNKIKSFTDLLEKKSGELKEKISW